MVMANGFIFAREKWGEGDWGELGGVNKAYGCCLLQHKNLGLDTRLVGGVMRGRVALLHLHILVPSRIPWSAHPVQMRLLSAGCGLPTTTTWGATQMSSGAHTPHHAVRMGHGWWWGGAQ